MLLVTYGTFREGEDLSYYLEYLREKGITETIELTGIKLFVLGMAPGAKITNDPNDKAIVELIDANVTEDQAVAVLDMLDQIEGVAHGIYKRDSVDTPKGKAIIYTKCGNIDGCAEITDWKEWQKTFHLLGMKSLLWGKIRKGAERRSRNSLPKLAAF